jgi:hypothetical protein
MARTALTTLVLKQDNYAIQPGDLALPFVAGDPINGNLFLITGEEILVIQNTDTVAHSFTALSTQDAVGRTDDLVYSVPANSVAILQFSVLEGYVQPDGNVYLNPSDAHIKFAVVEHL